MPDITLPNTFSDGSVLESEHVRQNIYAPKSVPDSLELINGRLDKDNLSTARVTKRMVRRGAFIDGQSVGGQTTNLDFFYNLFTGNFTAGSYSDQELEAGKVITGTTFFVPYDCEAIYLSWHVAVLVDAGFRFVAGLGAADVDSNFDRVPDDFTTAATETGNNLLIATLDGVPRQALSRRIANGFHSVLGETYFKGTGKETGLPTAAVQRDQFNDPIQPDLRMWSGHTIVDQTNGTDFIPPGTTQFWTKGRHTLDIEVVLGNWLHPTSSEKMITRHIKALTCRAIAIPVR